MAVACIEDRGRIPFYGIHIGALQTICFLRFSAAQAGDGGVRFFLHDPMARAVLYIMQIHWIFSNAICDRGCGWHLSSSVRVERVFVCVSLRLRNCSMHAFGYLYGVAFTWRKRRHCVCSLETKYFSKRQRRRRHRCFGFFSVSFLCHFSSYFNYFSLLSGRCCTLCVCVCECVRARARVPLYLCARVFRFVR